MPESKPLTTEDVNAATLPLHVGVDRVAAAREQALRAADQEDGKEPVAGEINLDETLVDRLAAAFRAEFEPASDPAQTEGAGVQDAVDPATCHRFDWPARCSRTVDDTWPALNIFPAELAQHVAALDKRGLVQLKGLPDTMDAQARLTWFAIDEIGGYLPETERRYFVDANVKAAGDVWQPCRVVNDGTANGPSLPGTIAVPAKTIEILGKSFNGATVEGVIGYIKAPHGG